MGRGRSRSPVKKSKAVVSTHVRVPTAIMRGVVKLAEENRRSINSEIVVRLEAAVRESEKKVEQDRLERLGLKKS
jgi:hypothetical protein